MLNNERVTLKHVSFNLDILPERYRRRRISFKQTLVILCTITGIALLVLLYQVASDTMYRTSELREEADILNARMQLRMMSMTEQVSMAALIDQYDEIDGKRDDIYQDMIVIKNTADQIGVTIDSMLFGSNSIMIVCPSHVYTTYSEYRDTFECYYQALLQTEQFATVERPPTDWSPSTPFIQIEVAH
jgi:hypothetical protein